MSGLRSLHTMNLFSRFFHHKEQSPARTRAQAGASASGRNHQQPQPARTGLTHLHLESLRTGPDIQHGNTAYRK